MYNAALSVDENDGKFDYNYDISYRYFCSYLTKYFLGITFITLNHVCYLKSTVYTSVTATQTWKCKWIIEMWLMNHTDEQQSTHTSEESPTPCDNA
jgi:hypothetical protein